MKTVFGVSVSDSYDPWERNSHPAKLRLTTGTDIISELQIITPSTNMFTFFASCVSAPHPNPLPLGGRAG